MGYIYNPDVGMVKVSIVVLTGGDPNNRAKNYTCRLWVSIGMAYKVPLGCFGSFIFFGIFHIEATWG